jgi:hypothetical protein
VSLADKIAQARPKMRGLPCPIATIVAALSEKDRVALLTQFDLPPDAPERLSNSVLAELLTDEGHRIHYKSIEGHRNRRCRCFMGSGL